MNDNSRASLGEVTATVARLAGTIPATPEQWDPVLWLGVSLAGPGQIPDRAQRHADLAYASGMHFEDRGMFDRTYGEIQAVLDSGVRPLPALA